MTPKAEDKESQRTTSESPPPHEVHSNTTAEAHRMFFKYHRHEDVGLMGSSSVATTTSHFPMLHRVAKTGVIYATSRATANGFKPQDEEWANMGQGAPETGPIEGAPPRDMTLTVDDLDLEYAPLTGLTELREKVANYYNTLYRAGKESLYTAANVCIVPGGRAGITRIMAVLGEIQVGYFCPDYTAYEQALGLFVRVSPSPFVHRDVNEAIMPASDFEFEVAGRGIGAVLLSNPCNPTGQSIEGDELEAYVTIARKTQTALILDEFYSHYYYNGPSEDESEWPKTVSSAAYIDDVNKDPIIIVNGLTKNWRVPGFRVCWIVAPKDIVDRLGSSGSFLDGGTNAPLQRMALPLMDLDFIRQDAWALQKHFKMKRDYLVQELARLNITVKWHPTSTFYVWADLSGLPPPLNDCLVFLEECVQHKVICVPGVFFDINPRSMRKNVGASKSIRNVRFSYGPPMQNLVKGIEHMEAMINKWKKSPVQARVYEEQHSSQIE